MKSRTCGILTNKKNKMKTIEIKQTLTAVLIVLTIILTMLMTSCTSTQNCCGKFKVSGYKPNVHKTNFNKKHYSL